MGSIPARYPPPWRVEDALGAPADADPIEVGVLVVGAGPAGLACAIRLGQMKAVPGSPLRDATIILLEKGSYVGAHAISGAIMDPRAVLEKGKQPGSHLLSGAVVNPRGLRRLFRERKRIEDMPFYGQVDHESVYFLTSRGAMRIPTPPTMKNHGNYVASRRRPRRAARRSSPRRRRRSCSSPTAACAACARATAAAGGTEKSCRTSRPARTCSRASPSSPRGRRAT